MAAGQILVSTGFISIHPGLTLFAIREYHIVMILKPQDVVVLLKLVAIGPEPWNFQRLAVELSISQSEVHAAVRRAVAARLMSDTSTTTGKPVRSALLEFLLHGVKYAFPPEHGALMRSHRSTAQCRLQPCRTRASTSCLRWWTRFAMDARVNEILLRKSSNRDSMRWLPDGRSEHRATRRSRQNRPAPTSSDD